LIAAFQTASGRDLNPWAEMWIRHRGMPRVDASFTCSGSRLSSVHLTQHPLFGGDEVWPIATEVALGHRDGTVQTLRAELNTPTVAVPLGPGDKSCPSWIFANNNDHAYGMFLLDGKSRPAVMQQLAAPGPGMSDLFRRTLLWGSLWDSVRQVELDPGAYVRLALDVLPRERDESLAASLLGRTQGAIHHYVGAQTQPDLLARGASLAADRMINDPDHDLRIVWFRSLAGFAAQPVGSAALKDLLAGRRSIPGVELRQQDRWSLVTALIAYGDPEADAIFAAEQKRDPSGDGLKYAWVARAARPDAATKRHYFDEYLHNPQRSEDWIQSSLGAFNFWNQAQLTAPYLEPALEALPQVKRERKIFFLVGWLDAFMDGQQSQASLETVQHYLGTASPDPDLRLKILEAMDELDRTVRIRAKFASQ
jgi:aminopeptidase N